MYTMPTPAASHCEEEALDSCCHAGECSQPVVEREILHQEALGLALGSDLRDSPLDGLIYLHTLILIISRQTHTTEQIMSRLPNVLL
jgi:hypothetical protein